MRDKLIKLSDAIAEIYKARTSDVVSHCYAELFINAICRAPSIDRPQGEWISPEVDSHIIVNFYKCSMCGKIVNLFQMRNYRFCPNCGARMKGVDDE